MRRSERQEVDATAQNCTTKWSEMYSTYAGTFLIKCKEFSNFFCNYSMKHLHIKKCDICNKAHRTCVSTYTLSCSCILHIKAYFVWHDGNCTALTCIKFGNHYVYLSLHIHICVNSSCHVCFTVVLYNKWHCSKIALLLLQILVFYFRCSSPQKKKNPICAPSTKNFRTNDLH